MPNEIGNAQEEDKPLSESARKLVDLIVRIIVNATLREVGMENEEEAVQERPIVKKANGARTRKGR